MLRQLLRKKHDAKVTKKDSSEQNSDFFYKQTDKEESDWEDEVKPRKNIFPKGNVKNFVQPKNHKGGETDLSNKKRVKYAKAASEDKRD